MPNIETNVNSCSTSVSFQRGSSLAEKKLNGRAIRPQHPNYLQQVQLQLMAIIYGQPLSGDTGKAEQFSYICL